MEHRQHNPWMSLSSEMVLDLLEMIPSKFPNPPVAVQALLEALQSHPNRPSARVKQTPQIREQQTPLVRQKVKTCCRNGQKVNDISKIRWPVAAIGQNVDEAEGERESGDDGYDIDGEGVDVAEPRDERPKRRAASDIARTTKKSRDDGDKIGGKGAEAKKTKTLHTGWKTDGVTPAPEEHAKHLVLALADIGSYHLSQDFHSFLQVIRQRFLPPATGSQDSSFRDLAQTCLHLEEASAVIDLHHMITLMRIAIHIAGSPKTKGQLAEESQVPESKLTHWSSEGTRLLFVAAAGSLYILPILAFLGMKTAIIHTRSSFDSIMCFSHIIRNPGMYCMNLRSLVQQRIIPCIQNMWNSQILVDLKFPTTVSSSASLFSIDFSNLVLMEKFLNGFKTNTFRLPARDPIWKAVREFGCPDWSASSVVNMPSSLPYLSPEAPQVPELTEAHILTTPFILKKPSLPFKESRKRTWTLAERRKASQAQSVENMYHFQDMLNEMHEGGTRSSEDYIHVPSSVLQGSTIKLQTEKSDLVFLSVSDSSGWLQNCLSHLHNVLQVLSPQSMVECDSSVKGYSFTSTHCDIFNRYAEKGHGAPPNVHPHLLYKEGSEEHVNHTQRIPYSASAIKENPDQYQAFSRALKDICSYIHKVIQAHLPDEYITIKAFVDVLPLNEAPTAYPFPGFVLNIQVMTDGHLDSGDNTICVVVPFGDWKGGELVLYELGLVLDMSPGDILVFPSDKITHFNLNFRGIRCSVVMHSDAHGKTWVENRNGWDSHIVV